MFTVKKFKAGETMQVINERISVLASSTTWAVMDGSKVAITLHPITQKPTRQTFHTKKTAQRQANFLNRQESA